MFSVALGMLCLGSGFGHAFGIFKKQNCLVAKQKAGAQYARGADGGAAVGWGGSYGASAGLPERGPVAQQYHDIN